MIRKKNIVRCTMGLTNEGLVEHAWNAYAMRDHTCYGWGCIFSKITQSSVENKFNQYKDWYASHSAVKNALTSLAAKTDEVNYAVDCSGLIKTYTMGGIGNVSYSGSKDYSANSYYANSPEKGDISSMPEIIGLAVHMDGHIGIYVGNGEVIESTPNTRFATQSHGGGGVCKTKLTDRKWKHWLKVPGIVYTDDATVTKKPVEETTNQSKPINNTAVLKEGCKGDDVTQLQKNLLALGFDPKGVDGTFGHHTKEAVIAFQKKNGLKPDGIVGPNTRKKMNDLLQIKNSKKTKSPTLQTVVAGAVLKCTLGSATSKLNVPKCHAKLNDKNIAIISDRIPNKNIMPFGTCFRSYPFPPCSPSFSQNWLNGDKDYKINQIRTVSTLSKLVCTCGGGVISVVKSGQNTGAKKKKVQDEQTPTYTPVRDKDTKPKNVTTKPQTDTTKKSVPMVGTEENYGYLSGKFENSKEDPGLISSGKGDHGGKSYGLYQFASKTGAPLNFVNWLKGENKSMYDQLYKAYQDDGNTYGEKFDAAWKEIAKNNKDEFAGLQFKYVKKDYYDATVSKIKNKTGFDVNTRSFALKNVVYARSVQNGAGGASTVISNILSKCDLNTVTDEEIIKQVYEEYSTTIPNDGVHAVINDERVKDNKDVYGRTLKYWKSSSSAVRYGVWVRVHTNEPNEALQLLEDYY